MTILDTISRLSSIYIHIAQDLIRYTLTNIYYTSCQLISVCYNSRVQAYYKEFIYSNQIGSFLTILDTISRLSSIYIHIAPDLIRYTLTTIYYPFCQQISVFYISIYIQQSNWVIFDHFGYYIQIIFNLYSYWTRFNSIHINYYILSIFSTNFSLLYLTSASLFTKNLYTAIKLGHFWPFCTLFPDYLQFIFILHQI